MTISVIKIKVVEQEETPLTIPELDSVCDVLEEIDFESLVKERLRERLPASIYIKIKVSVSDM